MGPSSLNGEARQAKSEADEFSNLRRKYDTSDGEDAIGIKQVAGAMCNFWGSSWGAVGTREASSVAMAATVSAAG